MHPASVPPERKKSNEVSLFFIPRHRYLFFLMFFFNSVPPVRRKSDGFLVSSLRFRAYGLQFIEGLGFRLRVQGFRVHGLGFRV